MSPVCSKCHKAGHNARTCSAPARAAKPKPDRRAMPPAAKPPELRAAAAAVAAGEPEISVLEALQARRARLQDELAGVERKKRELDILESTIRQITEIEED